MPVTQVCFVVYGFTIWCFPLAAR